MFRSQQFDHLQGVVFRAFSAVTICLLVCVVKLFIWYVAVCCLCVCVPDVLVCGMFGFTTKVMLVRILLLLLLLSSLSSSSSYSSSSISPLCRVSTRIFLRQTMSLGNTVLQLQWCYYSWCADRQLPRRLHLYVSIFRSMCAVPNMAVFCSSVTL